MIKTSIKVYTVSLFIVFALFLNSFAANKPKVRKMPLIHVDVYRVEQPKNQQVTLTYPARLKSIRSVTIVARVSGVLLKKFYKEGQFVKKGELLYKIEPYIYKAKYDAALAVLEKAKANLYKAKKDWKRYKALYNKKVISQEKMDDITDAYKSAVAAIDQAKANVESAKINLGYTNVKATISGITGLKLVDVGDYVQTGEKLVTITQIKPIYAEFSFADSDFLKIKTDILKGKLTAAHRLNAYITQGSKRYEGFVDFIDSKIDLSTSTVKARAIFKNKNGNLMPGEFVRVNVGGYVRKNVITIPQEALIQNSMGKMVFTVVKGRVVPRFVNVSLGTKNTFIVNSGLGPGELVVIDNFFKLRPGMPVKIDKIINQQQ